MRTTVVLATLGALAAAPALAQSGTATTQQPAQMQSGRAQSGQMPQMTQISTPEFVRMAAISNMFEIQSSELAQRQAQGQAVKQFAEEMIADHQKMTEQLQSTVRSANVNAQIPGQLDQRHAQMLDRLRSASGDQFDQAYMQMQVQAHQEALQLMQSYAQTGDNAQLQQLAQQAAPVIEEHLHDAQSIMQNVATGSVRPRQ